MDTGEFDEEELEDHTTSLAATPAAHQPPRLTFDTKINIISSN